MNRSPWYGKACPDRRTRRRPGLPHCVGVLFSPCGDHPTAAPQYCPMIMTMGQSAFPRFRPVESAAPATHSCGSIQPPHPLPLAAARNHIRIPQILTSVPPKPLLRYCLLHPSGRCEGATRHAFGCSPDRAPEGISCSLTHSPSRCSRARIVTHRPHPRSTRCPKEGGERWIDESRGLHPIAEVTDRRQTDFYLGRWVLTLSVDARMDE